MVPEHPDAEVIEARRLIRGIAPRLYIADQSAVDLDGQVEHPLVSPRARVLDPSADAVFRLAIIDSPRCLEGSAVARLLGPHQIEVSTHESAQRHLAVAQDDGHHWGPVRHGGSRTLDSGTIFPSISARSSSSNAACTQSGLARRASTRRVRS